MKSLDEEHTRDQRNFMLAYELTAKPIKLKRLVNQ